jgi:hypothetical protein
MSTFVSVYARESERQRDREREHNTGYLGVPNKIVTVFLIDVCTMTQVLRTCIFRHNLWKKRFFVPVKYLRA